MKITFSNNSVSSIHRKYRRFALDIPGSSSKTINVPQQYVNAVLSYLNSNFPAVTCTPAEEEPDATASALLDASASMADQTGESGSGETTDSGTENGKGAAADGSATVADSTEDGIEGAAATDGTEANGGTVTDANGSKKSKKSGGKK